MSDLVSVIVPVYNVAEYLGECVDSILAQTYGELEVILVDDGSTDSSPAICDAYARADARVRVYHLDNGGVSRARNYGMQQATGEYIMFADSDDVLLPHAVARGVELATRYGADIVYGMVTRTADMSASYPISDAAPTELTTREALRRLAGYLLSYAYPDFIRGNVYVSRGPWSRLVRRELALRQPFLTDIVLGEDNVWNQSLLREQPYCVIDCNCWYLYRINTASSSLRFRASRKAELTATLVALLPFARAFQNASCLFFRAWETLLDICRNHYFRAESGMSLLAATLDFRALRRTSPWQELCCYAYARPLGLRGLLRLLLMLTDTAVPVIYARDRIATTLRQAFVGGGTER